MKDSIKKCGNCFHFEFVYKVSENLVGYDTNIGSCKYSGFSAKERLHLCAIDPNKMACENFYEKER